MGGVLPDLQVRSQGWSQIANIDEMLEFLLALVEVAGLTFIVAMHPFIRNSRTTRADYERPRALFLYGLVGMVVGFLVLHHGYIIGFVIFGIGGLLRFRAESTSTADTTRLILMTLLGLCVGLDLPVIAFFAAICGWVAVLAFGRSEKFDLEVKFKEKGDVQHNMEVLASALDARGVKTLEMTKAKFKPLVQLVVEAGAGQHRADLIRHMTELQAAKEIPIDDWHLG